MNLEEYIEKLKNDELTLNDIPEQLMVEHSDKVFELFEEKRIIDLQEKYRKGKIKATDISSDDVKKIVKLYNSQISEMKDKVEYNKRKTEKYKEEIIKIKKEA